MRRGIVTTGLLAMVVAGCASHTVPAVKRLVSAHLEPGRDAGAPRPAHADGETELCCNETLLRPPQGLSGRWADVVIHHSGTTVGGAQRLGSYHSLPKSLGGLGWDELGYHFVIGNGTDTEDGEIEVGPRWRKQKHGAHCKTPDNWYNDHGIGICLVGDFEQQAPSPKQLASLACLLRFLMAECDLSISNVRTHGGITGQTACPGSLFSLDELIESLRGPVLVSSN